MAPSFPSNEWLIPGASPWSLMWQRGLHNTSKADMLTNLLIYMPLGLFLMRILSKRRCSLCMVASGLHVPADTAALPLATFNWLYEQWTDEQRNGLRNKLASNAEYLIHRIREKQRLSPYNAYLYNSPFQALIATTLAR